MTSNRPLAHALIHHIAVRVADAKASKDSFLTKVDFCVDREFSFGGMDFVWLYPAEGDTPVIESIGGELPASRPPYENALESLKQPGFHQVNDIEQVMSELRRRDVKILIEVMAWGGTWQGVEMGAFIADPLEQHLRTLRTCTGF